MGEVIISEWITSSSFVLWREDGSKLGWKDRWVIEVDQVRGLCWLSDYDVCKTDVYTLEPTGSQ
jgi:hypothetical protein